MERVGFDRADGGQSLVSIVWETDRSAVQPVHHANVFVSSANGEPVFRARSVKDPAAMAPAGRVVFTTRPGRLRVRLSAEDESGQSLDSEDREVLVPDFTTVRAMVTAPEIYRARTARELTQIRESSTALPTASHQFTRSNHLLLRFRAYAPGLSTPDVKITPP